MTQTIYLEVFTPGDVLLGRRSVMIKLEIQKVDKRHPYLVSVFDGDLQCTISSVEPGESEKKLEGMRLIAQQQR